MIIIILQLYWSLLCIMSIMSGGSVIYWMADWCLGYPSTYWFSTSKDYQKITQKMGKYVLGKNLNHSTWNLPTDWIVPDVSGLQPPRVSISIGTNNTPIDLYCVRWKAIVWFSATHKAWLWVEAASWMMRCRRGELAVMFIVMGNPVSNEGDKHQLHGLWIVLDIRNGRKCFWRGQHNKP